MKKTKKKFKDNEIVITAEAEQKKQLTLLKKERKIRGLTLFEYNEVTKEILPAKFKPVTVNITGDGSGNYDRLQNFELVVNQNCIYVQALNVKNALRKISKSYTPR